MVVKVPPAMVIECKGTGNKSFVSRFGLAFNEFLPWIILVIFSKSSSFYGTATAQTWFLVFSFPMRKSFPDWEISISLDRETNSFPNQEISLSGKSFPIGKLTQNTHLNTLMFWGWLGLFYKGIFFWRYFIPMFLIPMFFPCLLTPKSFLNE